MVAILAWWGGSAVVLVALSRAVGLPATKQQPAHDDTAIPVSGGSYAVMLEPFELAESAAVQFTRRYLDRPVGTVTNDGREGSCPGSEGMLGGNASKR